MKFALIGAAGYIAPRHLHAIKDVGGELVAALDPNDSVGILDRYFPHCLFFKEPERFERYLDMLRRKGRGVDYISICSPNYLHDSHVRMALRNGAHAICEKPLVIKPWNIDGLKALEAETGKKVNVILQLRLHPEIREIKRRYKGFQCQVGLHYETPRGPWYHVSWKGDRDKSGGLSMNIGIHLFDMLLFLFGECVEIEGVQSFRESCSGSLKMKSADVLYHLSIVPGNKKRKMTISTINSEPEDVDFTEGFENLHTESYRQILAGNGFGIEDARPSIELAHKISGAV